MLRELLRPLEQRMCMIILNAGKHVWKSKTLCAKQQGRMSAAVGTSEDQSTSEHFIKLQLLVLLVLYLLFGLRTALSNDAMSSFCRQSVHVQSVPLHMGNCLLGTPRSMC